MQFKIHHKEKLYFSIMVGISILFYALIWKIKIIIMLGFIALLALHVLGSMFLIGDLRGNAIKINKNQFPDIFEILESHAKKLNLEKCPDMYLLQGGGILNAFTIRFAKRNYVTLYSDILEVAYQEGMDAVSFIIGHELGHIKRNHTGFFKMIFILPARFIPVLGHAYSRACEYTCDNIGYSLCPEGALKGILILASGKILYKKININALMFHAKYEPKFMLSLAEIFATHPALIKRITSINQLDYQNCRTANDNSFISPKIDIENLEANR